MRTVSDSYLKLVCLLSTSAHSALEVLHIMRYINLLTYLHMATTATRMVGTCYLEVGVKLVENETQ